jgi:V/A-type H+-transporting ATPase subunit E
MSQQTEKLEGLLYAEAMNLAQQHLEKGRKTSDEIDQELKSKLHQLEQGEGVRYQHEAEQLYRQLVQAANLRINSELDRLRWALMQGVLADVRTRLEKVGENQDEYHQVLRRYLAEAARVMPEGDLIAELRPHDLDDIRPLWDSLVEQAAPGRKVSLAPLSAHASGGMMIRSEDGSLRVDNTFEGRLARMEDEVLGLIKKKLFQSREGESGGHE